MADTVWLQRPSGEVPWGFRLTGGSDQQQPLAVQRVTAGSIAATGLNKGDVVCGIGDRDTSSLTNAQANELIKQSGNLLQLHIAGSNRSPGAPPPMQQQQPTRLAQQLSDMSVGDGSYPFKNVPPSPASSAPGGPGYGAPSYVGGSNQSPSSPSKPTATSPVSPGQAPAMPDKVLNMAAKGPPEKKPWSYAPDTDSIRNQRDKVRRKQPSTNLPHYQHMLNMPDFNDPPQVVSPQGPPPGSQTPQAPEDQVGSDGVYVHAQYNSPLQMYSNDNVDEAFSGQTGGKVSGGKAAGPGNTPNKDIVMSPTYRLIHGLDAEKPKPKVMLPPEAARVDNNSLGVDDIGNYDETSIRYRGKNIPSKSFRMLQNMTGGPVENLPEPAPKARQRRAPGPVPPSPEQPDPDDIVDIRFVGGNIPSRSFRMLQQSIGDSAPNGTGAPPPSHVPEPHAAKARNVKIIKLRSQAQSPQHHTDDATDF